MKNRIFLSVLFGLSIAFAPFASAQLTDVKQTANGTQIGKTTGSKLGFMGSVPVARPDNSNTARAAMVALGLLAAGGAEPADTFTLSTSNTLGDATDIAVGTTTGTKIGTATGQKIAFHNSTPVIQRASASQTALTDSTGGSTANATLAAITTFTPSVAWDGAMVYPSAADATAIAAAITALKDAVAKEAKLLNEIRAALVEKGLIKGGA